MAITTVDDIVAGLAACSPISFLKVLGAAKAAGAFQSGWTAAGRPGAGVASPVFTTGSGYTCDRTTVGAWPYTNAVVQNWLARVSALSTVPGTVFLADRLWSCSGMGFAAATYTVTTPGTLPARITNSGVGCELWVENFVAAGAASGTLTANYQNTTPAAKSGVIAAVVSAPVAGQMQQVPLQAGDTGISQLTSVVTSATWTSGTFGMSIIKPIVSIPLGVASVMTALDWAQCLLKVPSDACLFMYFCASATTAAQIVGTSAIIDK